MIDNNKGLRGCGERETHVLLVKSKMVQSFWNAVWQFPKKFKSGVSAEQHAVWPLVLGGRHPAAHGVGWTNSQKARSELTQAVSFGPHPSHMNQQLPDSRWAWLLGCSLLGEPKRQMQALNL